MLKYFRDRRSMGWLFGSFLLILVIFAFIAFYVPDFMTPGPVAGAGDAVAWVDGEPISAREYLQGYRLQDAQYRQQLGAQYSPDLLSQLGLDNFVIQQLVQQKMLMLEARRQGLSVTDTEVSESIMSDPALQQDGRFIGREEYQRLLAGVGLTAAMYEQQVREDILRRKLQSLVTDGVVVTDADLKDEYQRRNEQAHLEYVVVPASDFEDEIEVSDEEARAYYEAHPEEFERPVQRKVRFITLTPQLFTSTVNVTDREIERYYNVNQQRFSTGEQVQASHILFEVGPDDDEELVRQQAEEVLAQVRSGADFAELARTHSDDPSAEEGGDLGTFGRGTMVPEFEQVAFSLPVGEVSDLVRTTYGFHIIKVTDKQPPMTQPLENVEEQIRGTLTQQKATEAMEEAIVSASEKLQASGSLDALTAEYPLLVPQDTQFFGRNDPLPQLGSSTEAARVAFETEVSGITPAIPLGPGAGYAFLQVLEEREAGVAPFDEVENQAREQLRAERAMKLAEARANEIHQQLASEGPEAADVELQSNESFFRGSQLSGAGRSAMVQSRAFEMPIGELSRPLEASNGYVIIRVVERSGFDPNEFSEEKASFEEQMLNERRSRLWGAYVADLQSRYDVQIDWRTVREITG